MQCWTLKDGLWHNDRVASTMEAQTRGGYMAFDPATLGLVGVPWSDGSGDQIRFTPILPDGTQVGTPVETEHGLSYPCTGPLDRIDIVDVQTTKWSIHRACDWDGIKIIWTMPTSRIKDDGDGVWRPKRTLVNGCQFSTGVQPRTVIDYDEDGEVANTREVWAAGSLVFYGAEDKHHNILHADGTPHKCYMTGKLYHALAHFASFWGPYGEYLGRVVGWYEWDAVNSHMVKCLPYADCLPFLAAGAVSVGVDDTVGYTTAGASKPSVRAGFIMGPFTPASSGTASSMSWYGAVTDNTTSTHIMGAYNDSTPGDADPTGEAYLASSQTSDSAYSTTDAWNTSPTYSSGPSIATTQNLWLFTWSHTTTMTRSIYFDNLGSGYYRIRSFAATAASNPVPSTCPASTVRTNNCNPSIYCTYSAGGGGGGTNKAVYDYYFRMMRRGNG